MKFFIILVGTYYKFTLLLKHFFSYKYLPIKIIFK